MIENILLENIFIMQGSPWENLTNPEELTTGLAILIVGMFGIFTYMSIKIRSLATMFGIVVSLFAFIITFLFEYELLYFWIALLFTSSLLFISMGIKEAYS